MDTPNPESNNPLVSQGQQFLKKSEQQYKNFLEHNSQDMSLSQSDTMTLIGAASILGDTLEERRKIFSLLGDKKKDDYSQLSFIAQRILPASYLFDAEGEAAKALIDQESPAQILPACIAISNEESTNKARVVSLSLMETLGVLQMNIDAKSTLKKAYQHNKEQLRDGSSTHANIQLQVIEDLSRSFLLHTLVEKILQKEPQVQWLHNQISEAADKDTLQQLYKDFHRNMTSDATASSMIDTMGEGLTELLLVHPQARNIFQRHFGLDHPFQIPQKLFEGMRIVPSLRHRQAIDISRIHQIFENPEFIEALENALLHGNDGRELAQDILAGLKHNLHIHRKGHAEMMDMSSLASQLSDMHLETYVPKERRSKEMRTTYIPFEEEKLNDLQRAAYTYINSATRSGKWSEEALTTYLNYLSMWPQWAERRAGWLYLKQIHAKKHLPWFPRNILALGTGAYESIDAYTDVFGTELAQDTNWTFTESRPALLNMRKAQLTAEQLQPIQRSQHILLPIYDAINNGAASFDIIDLNGFDDIEIYPEEIQKNLGKSLLGDALDRLEVGGYLTFAAPAALSKKCVQLLTSAGIHVHLNGEALRIEEQSMHTLSSQGDASNAAELVDRFAKKMQARRVHIILEKRSEHLDAFMLLHRKLAKLDTIFAAHTAKKAKKFTPIDLAPFSLSDEEHFSMLLELFRQTSKPDVATQIIAKFIGYWEHTSQYMMGVLRFFREKDGHWTSPLQNFLEHIETTDDVGAAAGYLIESLESFAPELQSTIRAWASKLGYIEEEVVETAPAPIEETNMAIEESNLAEEPNLLNSVSFSEFIEVLSLRKKFDALLAITPAKTSRFKTELEKGLYEETSLNVFYEHVVKIGINTMNLPHVRQHLHDTYTQFYQDLLDGKLENIDHNYTQQIKDGLLDYGLVEEGA